MPAVAPIPAQAGIGFKATAGALKAFTCTLAVQGEGGVGGRIGVMVDMVSTSNTISRIPLAGHKGGATAPGTNGNRAVGTIHSCFIFIRSKEIQIQCFHEHHQHKNST